MKPEDYRYWGEGTAGLLVEEADPRFPTAFYGWSSPARRLEVTDPVEFLHYLPLSRVDTAYVFVARGAAIVRDGAGDEEPIALYAGMWGVFPGPGRIEFYDDGFTGKSVAFAAVRRGFRALRAFGGPVEKVGRLRYIDGCSDTLLAGPARLGDPCLNLLHFPEWIDQTKHTHPSARLGLVLRGAGECRAWKNGPDAEPIVTPLEPGVIFSIPTDCLHAFRTLDRQLDVIAYHPETDWGPTDEAHPMVNRTLVDGEKIDNTTAQHALR